MKVIRRLCCDILGIVFGVSAFLKLIDPVGTGLIVDAYLKFFHLDFLCFAAKYIGCALSLTEMTVAVGLMSSVKRRFFAIATMVMLGFFTTLTIILQVFNPVMDCGCFGQAIHLTHLQSLIKNIVLLALSAVAFLPLRNLDNLPSNKMHVFIIGEVLAVILAVMSWIYLPLADFSTYKPSYTIVPESEASDDPEYPVLSVWDANGYDRSDEILDGRVMLMSFYDADIDMDDRLEAAEFAQNVYAAGMTPVIISTGEMDIPGIETYLADYKTLISVNRSNGGVTFLDDGNIVCKYAAIALPDYEDLDELSCIDTTELYIKTATRRTLVLQSFVLCFAAVLLLL